MATAACLAEKLLKAVEKERERERERESEPREGA